VSSQGPGARP